MKDRGSADIGAQAPQVYLVDDDALVLRTLARVLRRAGYRLATQDRIDELLEILVELRSSWAAERCSG